MARVETKSKSSNIRFVITNAVNYSTELALAQGIVFGTDLEEMIPNPVKMRHTCEIRELAFFCLQDGERTGIPTDQVDFSAACNEREVCLIW